VVVVIIVVIGAIYTLFAHPARRIERPSDGGVTG
jgi:hypothetical protein